jgi:hypothetical protein
VLAVTAEFDIELLGDSKVLRLRADLAREHRRAERAGPIREL